MGKEKIKQALLTTKEKGNKAFVPYIMAGDGGLERLKDNLLFLQEAGATMIEVGIPFSDPVADGPIIQEAGKRALKERISLHDILNTLEEVKKEITIPIIVMSYINPIHSYGIEAFAHKCDIAGVDGLIIPDLPLEQSEMISEYTKTYGIALIQLVSKTSSIERQKKLAKASDGFLYAVTVTGITGVRTTLHDSLTPFLQQVKELSDIPVLAGFGISNAQQALEVSENCDGVIIGSKIVHLLHEGRMNDVKNIINEFSKQVV